MPDEDGIDCPVQELELEGLNDNRMMTSISFPPTLTTIRLGRLPYENDPYPETLKEVHIRDMKAWINISYRGIDDSEWEVSLICKCSPLYLPDSQLYLNGEIVRDLVIPEGVSQVNELVFCGNKFNSITIPATLSKIYPFGLKSYDDSTPKAIYAPDLKTWCGIEYKPYTLSWYSGGHSSSESYFYPNFMKETTKLFVNGELINGELSFSEDLTAINAHSFQNYSYITSVNIGKNIKRIGGSAFENCKNLSTVRFEEGVTDVPVIKLAPIKQWDNMADPSTDFYYDGQLLFSTLYLPSTTATITIPGFLLAKKLRKVVVRANVPPEIKTNSNDYLYGWFYAFSDLTYSGATLYVPKGTVALYRNAEDWKNFKNIFEEVYDDAPAIEEDSTSGGIDFSLPYEIFSVSGIRMGCDRDELPAGIYIIRQNGNSRKIVRN